MGGGGEETERSSSERRAERDGRGREAQVTRRVSRARGHCGLEARRGHGVVTAPGGAGLAGTGRAESGSGARSSPPPTPQNKYNGKQAWGEKEESRLATFTRGGPNPTDAGSELEPVPRSGTPPPPTPRKEVGAGRDPASLPPGAPGSSCPSSVSQTRYSSRNRGGSDHGDTKLMSALTEERGARLCQEEARSSRLPEPRPALP
ncbi:unnamed protein product [Lampetra fluviatilis]